ncbi:MAG: hypothetical protein HZB16_02935 [Armatimonadetes bacterium]|nr:hypothetical protein [Armatimonadota bacterium]
MIGEDTTTTCGHCGASMDGGATVCGHCGTRRRPEFVGRRDEIGCASVAVVWLLGGGWCAIHRPAPTPIRGELVILDAWGWMTADVGLLSLVPATLLLVWALRRLRRRRAAGR